MESFNDLREKKEEEVYQRIYAVAEKIRLEKELDVLIDAKGVFSGGKDISDAADNAGAVPQIIKQESAKVAKVTFALPAKPQM